MAVLRPAGDFDRSYEQDMGIVRQRWQLFLLLGAILLACSAAFWGEARFVFNLNRLAYLIIALQGLNILTGYTGQISLGQAAFMLVGGYASGLLAIHLSLPIYLSIPLAALITGCVGLLFGLPSLRVKGFYLAMATLAAQFIIPWLTRQPRFSTWLGGTKGFIDIPTTFLTVFPLLLLILIAAGIVAYVGWYTQRPQFQWGGLAVFLITGVIYSAWDISLRRTVNIAGLPPTDLFAAGHLKAFITVLTTGVPMRAWIISLRELPTYYLSVSLITLLLSTILTINITRSRLGRALIAIRDNDLAAELLGVNLFQYKLRAFFIAAFLAGVAGALRAHSERGVGTEFGYSLRESILFLGMLVIGGLGTNLGPYLGGAFVIAVEDFALWLGPELALIFPTRSAELQSSFRPIFFGLVLVLFLIFEPRGLAHRWMLLKASWRLRPFAR
ncbi:MAG: branched-chain amino acid ABC transporter permease [Anaerolineae bacterium]|nr:branched-chain amino acid ABC transporter permease [Anaerolineae bacterium]